MSAPTPLRFRLLTDEDLPMLHRWLNDPLVVAWWEGDDVSWEGVVSEYGSGHGQPTEHWLALDGSGPVGWIQWSRPCDYPEWIDAWGELSRDPTTAGVDYLIGEAERRGRGLGAAMVDAFVTDVVFGQHLEIARACADPHPDNIASWRALEKAGFEFVKDIDDDEYGKGKLYCRPRAA